MFMNILSYGKNHPKNRSLIMQTYNSMLREKQNEQE